MGKLMFKSKPLGPVINSKGQTFENIKSETFSIFTHKLQS
jgi:hypothetical protein